MMMIQRSASGSVIVLLLALSTITAGCGDGVPRRYPASGTIQFPDGSPVMTGTIEISSGSRWTASAEISREGKFEFTTVRPGDGAIPGEYKVVVRQVILAHRTPTHGHDHGDLVHKKYQDYKTTPLTLTMPTAAKKDFELVVEKAK